MNTTSNTPEITPGEIAEQVHAVCEQRGVTPVAARERGSRRLGADHDDSDYDVLILFKNPIEDYLTIDGGIDHIHAPDDPIDVHGWDVRKFANLLLDSNPDAINFCRTETEYLYADNRFEPVEEDAIHNANLMALYHHYLSMAKGQYKKYIADEERGHAFRQFHVIHATACAKHIRETDSLPPLEIDSLLESGVFEGEIHGVLTHLLDLKRNGDNRELDDVVGDFLGNEVREVMTPTDRRTRQPNKHTINEYLRKELTS